VHFPRFAGSGVTIRDGDSQLVKIDHKYDEVADPRGHSCGTPALSWALIWCGDRKKGVMFNVMNTWLEAIRFSADVQRVMALRMMRLASGGPLAATEARQMISEKVFAFEEAQVAIVTALVTGSDLYAAAIEAYGPYERCVRANCLRLDS
jgi:hypothetical protein